MNTAANKPPVGYYVFFGFLFVLAAVLLAYSTVANRAKAADQLVVEDLRVINEAAWEYGSTHTAVAPTISSLTVTGDTAKRLNKYRYVKVSTNSYQLCATFKTARDASPYAGVPDQLDPTQIDSAYFYAYYHPKGESCYTAKNVPVRTVYIYQYNSGTKASPSTTPRPTATPSPTPAQKTTIQ